MAGPGVVDGGGDTLSNEQQHAVFARYVVPEIPVLYRVALSLTGQRADAEDLVQETLVRAFRAAGRFDGAHPRAWLLTILRRAHLNRVRVRRPDLLRDGDAMERSLETAAPPAASAEDEAISGELEAEIAAALAGLSQDHRTVVGLVDVQGLSYQEAADALGVPRGTVMSRLHRARAQIRDRLHETGIAPRKEDG